MSVADDEVQELLRLSESSDDRRHALVTSLSARDDHRCVDTLLTALHNRMRPAVTRRACSEILLEMSNAPENDHDELLTLWGSGDAVLRRHALAQMGEEERDCVQSVLRSPHHPLYEDAIQTLAFDFEPRWASQQLANALSHPCSAVRSSAAAALIWNEPLLAIPGLLTAIRDPIAIVACAALNTLAYYSPTLRVVSAVAPLVDHNDEKIRHSAECCLGEMQDQCEYALAGNDEESLRTWLAPVWDVLMLSDPPARSNIGETSTLPRTRRRYTWTKSPGTFAERFAPEHFVTHERELWDVDWLSIQGEMRSEFAAHFRQSPDARIRRHAAEPLALWQRKEDLLALAHDPTFVVKKSAVYHMKDLHKDPELAAFCWRNLGGYRCTFTSEALSSAIALSELGMWEERTLAVALDEQRSEFQRLCAISELGRAGDKARIKVCFSILKSMTLLTWCLGSRPLISLIWPMSTTWRFSSLYLGPEFLSLRRKRTHTRLVYLARK